MRRLQLWLATGLGAGYAPLAPGTFGSLPGLALAWLCWRAGGELGMVVGCAAVTAVGFWSARAAVAHFGREDPGQVVIDEVAGQMVALLFLAPTATNLVTGFLLFRLFDVWKPPPIRRLEALPGASGIMSDDLLAGTYANLTSRALQALAAWASGLA